MVIKKNVTIAAPAELIWDVVMDLRKVKEWAPAFEDYPYISDGWPASGATAIWRYHAGPLRFDFKLQLTKAERGRMLEIANRSAFGDGIEFYRFERNGGKTMIEYETRSRPNLLGRLFAAAMTRTLEAQMDQTVVNLKRYCEAMVR